MRLLSLILILLAPLALAMGVDEPLPDASQEARAKALFTELRCVVCQGESIADSPADVASDMRRVVRQHIASGDSDAAIKSYLVTRYGDFVLMRPPLKPATALLWLGPVLMLGAAILVALRYFRRQKP